VHVSSLMQFAVLSHGPRIMLMAQILLSWQKAWLPQSLWVLHERFEAQVEVAGLQTWPTAHWTALVQLTRASRVGMGASGKTMGPSGPFGLVIVEEPHPASAKMKSVARYGTRKDDMTPLITPA